MPKTYSLLLLFTLAALIVLGQTVFIVPETRQALVLQFRDPVEKHVTPGLKFKIPLIQQVTVFDRRVLDIDPPAARTRATVCSAPSGSPPAPTMIAPSRANSRAAARP